MPEVSQPTAGTAVDRILEHNRAYVARTPAKPFPPAEQRRLAVVACYDPRLDVLLLPALGLTPGEAFVLRTAGALVQPRGGVMRSLGLAVFMFGVTEIVVVGHVACRMATFKNNEFVDLFRRRGVSREAFGTEDLREWAGAIQDPVRGVQASIRNISSAPYLPKDVAISGLLFDEETGALRLVERGEAKETEPLPSAAEQAATADVQQAQADREDQETDAAAATQPTPQLDAMMAGLGQWLIALEKKASWKSEVQKLRRDLAATPGALQRLKLIETLARKATGESKEMIRAFDQIRKHVQAAPAGKIPDELQRFFQRWAGGTK